MVVKRWWWVYWFILVLIASTVYFLSRAKVASAPAGEQAVIPQIVHLKEASDSEGNLKITGTKRVTEDEERYVFNIVNDKEKSKLVLFEPMAEEGRTYSIPFNSWSSDNKYVFIQSDKSGETDYYVFKADGSLFGDGLKYLDIGEYWKEPTNKYSISQASGWAGPDLLMVYAKDRDGTKSTAYWFVVGSRKFVQVREF